MDIPLPYAIKSVTINPEITNKYPNGYFKSKPCLCCGKLFQPVAPSHHYCSNECATNAGAEGYLQRHYNLSLQAYKTMFKKQQGKCAICGSEGFTLKESQKTKLIIDHDHKTGKVRGLLCPNCNRGLGLFQENTKLLEKAKEYINKDIDYRDTKKSSRLTRNRITNKPIDKETLFNLYKDAFENRLRTLELARKYSITKETVKALRDGASHTKELKEYQEGATTIQ